MLYAQLGGGSSGGEPQPEASGWRGPEGPQVLLVATHRNALHEEPLTRDATIEELFAKIRRSLAQKPYGRLLHPKFFALDTGRMSFDEPRRLQELRQCVDRLARRRRLASAAAPIGWLRLQRLVERLASRGVHFVARSQLAELLSAQLEPDEPLLDVPGLQAALQFLHSQGKLLCFCQPGGAGQAGASNGAWPAEEVVH